MGKSCLSNFTHTVTQIFLVLHPRHKLHYVKTAGWEDEWIKMAHNIICEEFDRTYAFMDLDDSDDEVVMMDKVQNNANCETYCC